MRKSKKVSLLYAYMRSLELEYAGTNEALIEIVEARSVQFMGSVYVPQVESFLAFLTLHEINYMKHGQDRISIEIDDYE